MTEPHVVPRPGQSLGGLIIEAASALGERTIRGILAEAGTSLLALVHHAVCPEQLATVAESLELEPDALGSRLHARLEGEDRRRSYFGVPVDHRLLEKRARFFAPATLATGPWHRASWQLRMLPFCETSWTLVTDACHACGTIQRWSRAWGIDLCDVCTTPLCEGSTDAVPARFQPALRLAGGLLHHDDARREKSMMALPHKLRGLGVAGCVDVLCGVAGIVDPTIRDRHHPHHPASAADRGRATVAIATAWDMIAAWPAGVLAECDTRLARRIGRHGDGNQGATAAFLRLGERNGISAPLCEAVKELRSIVAERQLRHVDTREFARLSGVAARNVARSRRAGRIRSVLGMTDAGEVVPLLPFEEAEASRRVVADGLMAERAAARIGCTYRGVEELIETGHLRRSSPSVDNCLSDRLKIEAESLDELFSMVSHRAMPLTGGRDLTLAIAMRGIGGRLKPWSALLSALLEGRLPYALRSEEGRLANRILIHRDDLQTLQKLPSEFNDADPRFDQLVSKKDAFSILNTEARYAEDLLERWETSSGPERTVPLSEALLLARRFVSLREIAARSGSTASGIARKLARLGVHPARCALFERAAVFEVLKLAGDQSTAPTRMAKPAQQAPSERGVREAGEEAVARQK